MSAEALGDCGSREAECVVRFYCLAEGFLALLGDAATLQRQTWATHSSTQVQAAFRRLLDDLRGSLPGLTKTASEAKSALEGLAGATDAPGVPGTAEMAR